MKKFLLLLIILSAGGYGGYYYYENYYKPKPVDPAQVYQTSLAYAQGANKLPVDKKKSFELLQQSAELGYAKAQMQLAYNYHTGNLTQKNEELAIKWYTKAAKQNIVQAQYMLGYMYEKAMGVPKNDDLAMQWYSRASYNGNQNAQLLLGVMYAKHEKHILSYAWLNLAATTSNDKIREKAVALRDSLAEGMTPEEIKTAQSQSTVFYEKIQMNKSKVPKDQ